MSWSPSSSVTSLRNMLESCDNRAGSDKRNGAMFHRHAERSQVADAVIEAERDNPITLSFIISYDLLPPVTRVLSLPQHVEERAVSSRMRRSRDGMLPGPSLAAA